MSQSIINIFAGLILCVVMSACGTMSPTVLDERYESIHVSVFENETVEYGVQERFTHSMIDAFQRDGRLQIKPKSSADLEMDAVIQDIQIFPLAYTDFDRAVGYGMSVAILVTVVDTETGEAIMQKKPFAASGNFFLQSEPTQSQTQDVAIIISENILSNLLEGW